MMRTQIMSKYPNLQLQQFHILGHSLGAHIAGNVGRSFDGQLGRVTGLDPAHPLFNSGDKDWISPSTAQFVDTIHTAGNTLGQMTPTGHISFYPNGGPPPQPGCLALDYTTFIQCSHLRAPIFYAESIIHPKSFPAVKCDFETISNDAEKCPSLRDAESIKYMGESVDKSATGTYYFLTYSVPPYGKGASMSQSSQKFNKKSIKIFLLFISYRILEIPRFVHSTLRAFRTKTLQYRPTTKFKPNGR